MKSRFGVIHAAQSRVKKTIVRIDRTERKELRHEEIIDENVEEDAVEEDKEVEVDDNNKVVLFVVFCVEFNCCESLAVCCCGVVRLELLLALF